MHIELEKGRSAFVNGERRPADILARGCHNYKPAEGKELFCDWVNASALCKTVVAQAAQKEGAAAQAAADRKHTGVKGIHPLSRLLPRPPHRGRRFFLTVRQRAAPRLREDPCRQQLR